MFTDTENGIECRDMAGTHFLLIMVLMLCESSQHWLILATAWVTGLKLSGKTARSYLWSHIIRCANFVVELLSRQAECARAKVNDLQSS